MSQGDIVCYLKEWKDMNMLTVYLKLMYVLIVIYVANHVHLVSI